MVRVGPDDAGVELARDSDRLGAVPSPDSGTWFVRIGESFSFRCIVVDARQNVPYRDRTQNRWPAR